MIIWIHMYTSISYQRSSGSLSNDWKLRILGTSASDNCCNGMMSTSSKNSVGHDSCTNMNSNMNSYELWIHMIFSYMNSYVSWIHIWIRVYQGSRYQSAAIWDSNPAPLSFCQGVRSWHRAGRCFDKTLVLPGPTNHPAYLQPRLPVSGPARLLASLRLKASCCGAAAAGLGRHMRCGGALPTI